jgi:hypothetical protein
MNTQTTDVCKRAQMNSPLDINFPIKYSPLSIKIEIKTKIG